MDALSFPICPVCLELIVLPVTLPCGHELCLECFKSGVDLGNFHCPVCRKRISSWARNEGRDPLNKKRQKELEELYKEFGSTEDLRLAVSLQQEENKKEVYGRPDCPGKVSTEYEMSLERFLSEEAKLEKENELEAIRLQEKEKERMEDELRQLEMDEKIAKELFEETRMEQDSSVALQIESDRKMAIELEKSLKEQPINKKPKQWSIKKWLVQKPSQ